VKRELKATDRKCTVQHNFVQVSGISAPAASAINKSLVRTKAGRLLDVNCATEGYDSNGDTVVSFNGKGILSVADTIGSDFEGAAHPNTTMTTSTFDLRSGKELSLSDVLLPAGLKELQKACQNVWSADDDRCDAGAHSSFTIEANGVRFVQPSVARVVQ
jgi:hypothetical protein